MQYVLLNAGEAARPVVAQVETDLAPGDLARLIREGKAVFEALPNDMTPAPQRGKESRRK